jgi:hypothetical protein
MDECDQTGQYQDCAVGDYSRLVTRIEDFQLKKIIFIVLMACSAYANMALATEAPEGIVFCHGKTEKFMSAYSWFGSNQVTPEGLKYAILGRDLFDPLLVFDTYLIDANQNRYVKCN